MKDMSKRTQSLEEGMKRRKLEMREVKREEEKIKAEVSEVNKAQEELWDTIAMKRTTAKRQI